MQDAITRYTGWLAGQRGRLGVQRRSNASALTIMECVRLRFVFWGMPAKGTTPVAAKWRLVGQLRMCTMSVTFLAFTLFRAQVLQSASYRGSWSDHPYFRRDSKCLGLSLR